MKPILVALLASCPFTSSCVSVPPIETPSGRPECTIQGANASEVQSFFMDRYISDGWMLKDQTPSQLVLWKENASTWQNVFLGSQYDPTTTYEIRLVFASRPNGTGILGQIALVTNEGSAFEQRNDLTGGKAGYQLWQALSNLGQQYQASRAPGRSTATTALAR